MQVPSLGPARYTQAAGFLKIPGATNPLDHTWIHPESYGLAERILGELGYGADVLGDASRHNEMRTKLSASNVGDLANRLGAGVPTVADIVQALLKPGRDPREDLPPPIFKKGILRLEDLQPGMELKGHGAERRRFRRFCGHWPQGQRAGAHQPDGQPLHQESL